MSLDKCRPLWEQGMFLKPQHFQQQSRHTFHQLQTYTKLLNNELWGISSFSYKYVGGEEKVLNILQLEGIFQNGVPFTLECSEQNPIKIQINASHESQTLYCCFPFTENTNFIEPLSQSEETGQVYAYKRAALPIFDENVGKSDGEEITVATPNITFKILATPPDTHFFSIPIIKISSIKESETFNPAQHIMRPAPVISGCLGYDMLLENLLSLTTARAEQLASGLTGKNPVGGAMTIEFFYLQCLNKFQAYLEETKASQNSHPRELFLKLKETLYEMATYIESSRRPPSTLPLYQHEKPHMSFAPLWAEFKKILETQIDKVVKKLNIETHQYGVRSVRLQDKSILQAKRFILAVSSELPAAEVVSLVPRNIKLAPIEDISHIVNSLLEGVAISHLSTSPQELPHQDNFHYFEMSTEGKLWEKLSQSKALAMHLTDEIIESLIEVWAIYQ